MKVQNKVVVVTGGGNGMGRALVLALLAKGARVAAVDINAAALEETLASAGGGAGRLSTHRVDITDREGVAALPEAVVSRHGAVDGLINNAGIIQPFVPVVDLDEATIQRVMAVNFYGTLAMTRAFLPGLLQRPEAHIANVASMGGFFPFPRQTIYGASKAAVKLFTEGLRAELLDTHVGVTVVFPGALDTDIAGNSGAMGGLKLDRAHSPLKLLSPVKAAERVIAAIERNRYRALIGTDAVLMDFFYKLSPRLATGLISRVMGALLS
ncbi:MAG: SDR family oxidoreductase [Anaerolineae bacterium]|jgi:NAD(P)-dependent dehydrogenase (short-subunit alcohol dehydrogenase family)|nr:SDR family oxidoreductase [Anaerolineae bacterium]